METNIDHWEREEALIPPLEEKLASQKRKYDAEHKERSVEVAAQKSLVTPFEYSKLEDQLKVIAVKIEAAEHRYFACVNMRWWIGQHMRGNCRRLVFMKGMPVTSLRWRSASSSYHNLCVCVSVRVR